MKIARFLPILLICLTFVAVSANAQRTSTKRPIKRAVARTTASSIKPSAEVTAARQKVSNQLSNVNRFIDVLGPIALNIENLDREARTRKIAKASIDANEANKQKVVEAIRNLRTGLINLEADFRTKTDLGKYLSFIQGIANLAAESEDSALSGRFIAAKDPLRAIAQKLTDTLAALPKG